MEYFCDQCKVRPAEILYTLIVTTMFNCWVFRSANSVTRPDRDNQYNMRIKCTDMHTQGAQDRTDLTANWKSYYRLYYDYMCHNSITRGYLTSKLFFI